MIVDNISNAHIYHALSPDIALGLTHLAELDQSEKLGSYDLSNRVKVLITEYETAGPPFSGYEAHRQCIDIQYPIRGRESVLWAPLAGMTLRDAYDPKIDRLIVDDPERTMEIITGEEVFAIFFPDDAHRPCLPVKGIRTLIRKATIKVQIS